jgi:GCN5-related N-acetyl-transferase
MPQPSCLAVFHTTCVKWPAWSPSSGLAKSCSPISSYQAATAALPLRGHGLGYRLVRDALNEVRRLNLKVVPECWFVREVIERNPEFQDLR